MLVPKVLKKLLVLITLFVSGCATGPPAKPNNLCAIFSERTGWHRAAIAQQKKWQVPMYTTLAIMAQESSFRSTAVPPRKYYLGFIPGKRLSSAYGYPQALDGTWRNYLNATGESGRRRDNFADSLDFSNWYITRSASENGIAKNDTYRNYLNYHEGWVGYRRGSYKKKSWLIGVARKVETRAGIYASQHQQCLRPPSRSLLQRVF